MADQFKIQPIGYLVGANAAPEESKGKWGMIGALTPNMIQMLQVMSTAQLETRIVDLETHDKDRAGEISKLKGQVSNLETQQQQPPPAVDEKIVEKIAAAQKQEAIAVLKEHFTLKKPCTVLWAVGILAKLSNVQQIQWPSNLEFDFSSETTDKHPIVDAINVVKTAFQTETPGGPVSKAITILNNKIVTVHTPHSELVRKSVKKIRGSSKC